MIRSTDYLPRKRFIVVVLAVMIQSIPFAAAAPQSSSSRGEGALEQARAWFRQFGEKNGVPGYSVAVAVDGRIVWAEGFGKANVEMDSPATPQTVYRIGSVTKLFTAAAAMLLVEQGRLDLDAPVQKYVPQFPEKPVLLTLRRLAGHLSGIRNYRGNEYGNTQRATKIAETVARFKDDPLLHDPGSKYAYSSYNYVLFGTAMENASGRDFVTLLRETVLLPLGLKTVAPDLSEAIVPGRSGYYQRTREGRLQNCAFADHTDRLPAGGYHATVEDLARFGVAMTNDSLLKAQTRAMMFASQKLADGRETRVGIAWRVAKDAAGRTFVHHGGDAPGGRAFLLVYPEQRVVVAFAANLSFAPFAEQQAAEVAKFFLDPQ